MILNAREFCEKTNFPLKYIRRLCRQNLIPNWNTGSQYLLDEEEAMKVLAALRDTRIKMPVKSSRAGSAVLPGVKHYDYRKQN